MTCQGSALDNYVPGTSRKARTARTLLLRMAADEARAERIRHLKREHPELTWQAIADQVGVTLRAAQSWQEKGSISYGNAKKLASVLGEDVDFIMRGPRSETPDLLGVAGLDELLLRMESRLAGLIEHQNNLLSRQSLILERIEARLDADDGIRQALDDSAERLAESAREAARRLREASLDDVQPPARARRARAKTGSRPASS
jgi:transcriptional regulator with XRE-family HTH domain